MQKDTLSSSSAKYLVNNMEESSSGNMDSNNNVAASPKTSKSVKAGEKAPPEAIKSWKENGFSRFMQFSFSFYSVLVNIFCLNILNRLTSGSFSFLDFYFQFDYRCSKPGCLGHCKRTGATCIILGAICDLSPVSPGIRSDMSGLHSISSPLIIYDSVVPSFSISGTSLHFFYSSSLCRL